MQHCVYLLFAWQVRDCSSNICCSCFSWSNPVSVPSRINIPERACEHLAFSRPRHRDIIWFQVAFALNRVSQNYATTTCETKVKTRCFLVSVCNRGKINVLLYCFCVNFESNEIWKRNKLSRGHYALVTQLVRSLVWLFRTRGNRIMANNIRPNIARKR